MLTALTTSDMLQLGTAIATGAIFLAYVVIAIFTIRMANATAKSAEVSSNAFKEGLKYQELAANHQELSSFINLFNLLATQNLSQDMDDLEKKIVDIMARAECLPGQLKQRNLAREVNSAYVKNLKPKDMVDLLGFYNHMQTVSQIIYGCYPLLSNGARSVVISLYSKQAKLFFPFYNDNIAVLFGGPERGAEDSYFGWLYRTAQETLDDLREAKKGE